MGAAGAAGAAGLGAVDAAVVLADSPPNFGPHSVLPVHEYQRWWMPQVRIRTERRQPGSPMIECEDSEYRLRDGMGTHPLYQSQVTAR
jgi:hypothetical protein